MFAMRDKSPLRRRPSSAEPRVHTPMRFQKRAGSLDIITSSRIRVSSDMSAESVRTAPCLARSLFVLTFLRHFDQTARTWKYSLGIT
jgi:hypothetical protein